MNTMVRKMDTLHRVVLPREMMAAAGIKPRDCLSIMADETGTVTLVKGETGECRRRVDELGRILLSPSIRNLLNLNENAEMRISCEDGKIILKSNVQVCRLCGSETGGSCVRVSGHPVCERCLKSLSQPAV